MSKITAAQLAIAKEWQDFGDRLGWELVSCDDAQASFLVGQSAHKITQLMRADIERTWREAIPSNVAKIGAGL